MKVVSFYTKGTPYEDEAAKLVESLDRHDISHCIYPVENRGSWQKNTLYKPRIIQEAMREFDMPILWVDADATFHGPLYDLFAITRGYDWAAYIMDKAKWKQDTKQRTHSLMSGTVWFANTVGARNVLHLWQKIIDEQPKEWDQRSLERVWKMGVARFCELSVKWCRIDKTHWGVSSAIIRHHQASRRLRKEIK